MFTQSTEMPKTASPETKSLLEKPVQISPNVNPEALQASNRIGTIKQNNQEEIFRLFKMDTPEESLTDETDLKCEENSLYWAASHGFVHSIDLLVTAGADVNKQDQKGRTPVFIASQHGHAEAIAALHAAGADVNTPNEDGATPVYAAAYGGHAEAIVALHLARANVDVLYDGVTSVYVAAEHGHAKAIAALHAAGANVSTPDENGETPVYAAAYGDHAEAIAALHLAGANMDTPYDGATPVYAAAKQGHASAVTALHLAGANMDTPYDGATPVYAAAKKGHASVITALHSGGANMDTPYNGATPVYAAAYGGHSETIVALHSAGANMDTPYDGITPVYVAAKKGHVSAVTALLEAGADANTKTRLGTALERAKKNEDPNHSEIVEVLEAHFKQYPKGTKLAATEPKDSLILHQPARLVPVASNLNGKLQVLNEIFEAQNNQAITIHASNCKPCEERDPLILAPLRSVEHTANASSFNDPLKNKQIKREQLKPSVYYKCFKKFFK